MSRRWVLMVSVGLLLCGRDAARADVAVPHRLTASQQGPNVELKLYIESVFIDYPGPWVLPDCDVVLHRTAQDETETRLFDADLRTERIDCPEGCDWVQGGECTQQCVRVCRTFADVCPPPGSYVYSARIKNAPEYDDSAWTQIMVWPASGACEARPGTVTEEPSGCSSVGGPIPPLLVFAMLTLGAFLAFRRRR